MTLPFVCLSPDVSSQYTPTVVPVASRLNGRTPLTPSHGNRSHTGLTLAFVAFHEPEHEELLREGGQHHTPGLAVLPSADVLQL